MAKRANNFRHGHSAGGAISRTYRAWQSMLARCEWPKHNRFHRYGGRGITVCPAWHDFQAFLSDMGECPPGLTLERREKDGNYQPGNCRWATQKEQQQNRSTNRFIEANGRRLLVVQWAELLGCHRTIIHARLARGWSETAAVTTPRLSDGRPRK